MIQINIEKARKVWRQKIADARKDAFEKNDIAIRDAQIAKNKTALKAAIQRRDELRSLGDKIDSAMSVDELISILP